MYALCRSMITTTIRARTLHGTRISRPLQFSVYSPSFLKSADGLGWGWSNNRWSSMVATVDLYCRWCPIKHDPDLHFKWCPIKLDPLLGFSQEYSIVEQQNLHSVFHCLWDNFLFKFLWRRVDDFVDYNWGSGEGSINLVVEGSKIKSM